MRKIIATTCLLFCCMLCHAQKIDYKDMRENNFLANYGPDAASTQQAKLMLLRADTGQIGRNKDMYLHDLGFVYYKLSLQTGNRKYMDTAVATYKRALKINAKNKDVLWDLAIALIFSKPQHCKEGIRYLDRYVLVAPANEVDTEAITNLREICNKNTTTH